MPLAASPTAAAFILREKTESVIKRFEIACRQEAVRLGIEGVLLMDYATLILAQRLAERSLLVDGALTALALRLKEKELTK